MKLSVIGLLTTAAAALGLTTGCQGNNNSTSAASSRTIRGSTASVTNSNGAIVGTGAAAGIQLSGQLTSTNDASFQSNAQGLVDSSIPNGSLGHVSDGSVADGTGIYFGAQVSLTGVSSLATNGVLGSGIGIGNNSGSIDPSSTVLIGVWDTYAASNNSVQGATAPVLIFLSNAQGYINGSQAVVQFSDDYGSITFQGTINASTFSGQMYYNNQINFDGSAAGAQGLFTNFQIPVCGFFVCN